MNRTIIDYFLKMTGILWVGWPKASSKIETDLSWGYIGKYLLENGFIDAKVCVVDQDWSSLKFRYRINYRKYKTNKGILRISYF